MDGHDLRIVVNIQELTVPYDIKEDEQEAFMGSVAHARPLSELADL